MTSSEPSAPGSPPAFAVSSVVRLKNWVTHCTGWRRRGVAFAAGGLSVLALAPFFLWPVLFVTLPVLVWLVDASADEPPPANPSRRWPSWMAWRKTPPARAAGAGWWFGLGYFAFGLFWLGEAFLVEAATFAWLLPFAVTLMPAGLALFYAAATAATWQLSRPGLSRVLVLAVCLGIAEWLRGHILTGFPWNVLGYALTYPLPLMQMSGVLGIYGLTLWTVLVCAAPLVLLGRAGARNWALPVAIATAPLAAFYLYGLVQMSGAAPPDVEGVRLRVVQPSVPQREKWQPENQRSIFDLHLALSRSNAAGETAGLAGITHVVWPEAAMPFFPLEQPQALSEIRDLLGSDVHLVTGSLRRQPKPGVTPPADPASRLPPRSYDYFNSLIVFGGPPRAGDTGVDMAGVSGTAGVGDIYDKIHLVPFGEYLPMQAHLESIGLKQLTRLRGGFAFGPSPRPLISAGKLDRIGPLICYEAVFPGEVVQGSQRPRALINLTNDGWFGNTTGPRQHLHQARVRAVEEGLPLVRAANNGISAVIGPDGRMRASLGMNVKGVIDAPLPGPLSPPPYARLGDWIFAVNLLIFGLLALYARARYP